ncbi:MAG: hypothetical protein R3D59_06670 [Paracoccaceae bacterium]
MPGLVNSHHHLRLTPLQLGAPDYALELWFAARLAMRKIDPYLDTLFLGFRDDLVGGDHRAAYPGLGDGRFSTPWSLPQVPCCALMTTSGMRVSYCYAVRRTGDRFVYEADEDFCRRLPPDAAKAMAAYFAQQALSFDDFMKLFDLLTANYDQARPHPARARQPALDDR